MSAIRYIYILYLLISASIWGFAFVAQKDAMSFMQPMFFNALRFFLGGFVLLIVFSKKILSIDVVTFKAGVVLGLFLFLGSSFQQIGIQTTQAGNAGFVTALYIVFIPLVGLMFKRETPLIVWLAIFIALAGFALLSIDFKALYISYGDFLVLIGSFCWALHVSFVEHYASLKKTLELATIQFFVSGILSLTSSFIAETPMLPTDIRPWISILYAGIFSAGIAFTLQIYAQRFVPSSIAGIVLSSEAVFALLGGMLILNEYLLLKQWLGVVLILLSVILVQIFPALLKGRNYAYR